MIWYTIIEIMCLVQKQSPLSDFSVFLYNFVVSSPGPAIFKQTISS